MNALDRVLAENDARVNIVALAGSYFAEVLVWPYESATDTMCVNNVVLETEACDSVVSALQELESIVETAANK